mgnify:CR=1 FL=1
MSADYTVQGDVAVIALNNPPVNGLGLSTRLGIMAGLEKAIADDAIKAIVVTGAGKFIEVQGTAEGAPFSPQELNALMLLGQKGVAELVQHQQQALQQVQPQNR